MLRCNFLVIIFLSTIGQIIPKIFVYSVFDVTYAIERDLFARGVRPDMGNKRTIIQGVCVPAKPEMCMLG